jgi:hypothetical protein
MTQAVYTSCAGGGRVFICFTCLRAPSNTETNVFSSHPAHLQPLPVHGLPAKLHQAKVVAHVQVRQQHACKLHIMQTTAVCSSTTIS